MTTRSFFYLAGGLLILALACRFAEPPTVLAGPDPMRGRGFAGIAVHGDGVIAVTASGAVWARNAVPTTDSPTCTTVLWTTTGAGCPDLGWQFLGNIIENP